MADSTTETTESTEVEETFESDEQGLAYTSETSPSAAVASDRPATIAPGAATGRRKEAVARVRIVPGTGVWTINGRTLESYFPNKLHQQVVNEPFTALGLEGPLRRHRPHPRRRHHRPGRRPPPRRRPVAQRDRPRRQPRDAEEGRPADP